MPFYISVMLLGLPDDMHEEKPSFLQFKKTHYGRTDGRTDRPSYRDARMHLKISFFSFGHSHMVWVDAEKSMKKLLVHCQPLNMKKQICIGIAKIVKLKTWPLPKFILYQDYVIGNANFDPGRQIYVFTRS